MGVFAKDRIFKNNKNYPRIFKFNFLVADVFDNMIKRSVPFYKDIQNLFCYFGKVFIKPSSNVYDLGCSTGYTLSKIIKIFPNQQITYFAVDNSADMLIKTKKRLRKNNNIKYLKQDLNKKLKIENSSMVIANLVLQFLKYPSRLKLLKNIYQGLIFGGAFILVEKVINKERKLDQLFVDNYHVFKKDNNYSLLEIERKSHSLKNILQPITMSENIDLLRAAGFHNVEVFFRWFNFCGFIAVK